MSFTAHNGLQGFRASGLQGFRASGLQGDGRDIVADNLRGLAIILVVYAHIVLGFENSGILFPHFIIASKYIYSFHMPLMFMLAGYVQGMKGYTFTQCLKKSAIALYFPCMYFSLVRWCIMYFIFSRHNPANFDALQSGDFAMIPLEGFKEYWFLAALFFIKVIQAGFECYGKKELWHFLFWAIVLVVCGICGESLPEFIKRLSYGLYFHAGYILRTRGLITQDSHPKFLHGLAVFLAGAIFFAIPYKNPVTSFLAAICSCLGLFVMFYSLRVRASFLTVYGLYSMVVYCLHNWITACFRMAFTVSGMSVSADPLMMFTVSFVAAMVIPLVVVWLYKNVNCLRWVEYVFYPGKCKKNPPAQS